MSTSTDLSRQMNRSILKDIVSYAIFDSDGNIADVRRSILVEVTIVGGKHVTEVMSARKFDSLPSLADTVGSLPIGSTIEVWDGRYLFGPMRSHSGYLRYVSEEN